MKEMKILGIMVIIVGIFLIGVELQSDYDIKEVKCYDRHNNEIIGQTCLDDSSSD